MSLLVGLLYVLLLGIDLLGLHGSVDVFSLGADGTAGGDGYDADIGNWMD